MTELFVHLDRSDAPVYKPGEVVTARILVSAPRETQCKQLFARLRHVAHGKGNLHHTVVEERPLYAGEISPGQHEYTVQFTLPYGPYDYTGHYLNLNWEVQAYLDIPWAIDKKGSAPFSLVPDGVTQPPSHLEKFEAQPSTSTHSPGYMLAAIGAVLCILAASIILGAGVAGMGCAIVNGVIGLIMLLVGLRRFLTTRVIKMANVHITPWPVRTGRNLGYRLEFTPGTNVTINQIAVRLRVREVVIRGSGTNSSTFTHDILDERIILAEQVTYTRGQRVTLSHVIPLGRDLPPSIDIPSNRLNWELISEIDIPNWPDWKDTSKLQVLPGYALFSEEEASSGGHTSDWDKVERGAGKPPGPSW